MALDDAVAEAAQLGPPEVCTRTLLMAVATALATACAQMKVFKPISERGGSASSTGVKVGPRARGQLPSR